MFGNTKTRATLTTKFKKGIAPKNAGKPRISKTGRLKYAPINTAAQITPVGIVNSVKATCLIAVSKPTQS